MPRLFEFRFGNESDLCRVWGHDVDDGLMDDVGTARDVYTSGSRSLFGQPTGTLCWIDSPLFHWKFIGAQKRTDKRVLRVGVYVYADPLSPKHTVARWIVEALAGDKGLYPDLGWAVYRTATVRTVRSHARPITRFGGRKGPDKATAQTWPGWPLPAAEAITSDPVWIPKRVDVPRISTQGAILTSATLAIHADGDPFQAMVELSWQRGPDRAYWPLVSISATTDAKHWATSHQTPDPDRVIVWQSTDVHRATDVLNAELASRSSRANAGLGRPMLPLAVAHTSYAAGVLTTLSGHVKKLCRPYAEGDDVAPATGQDVTHALLLGLKASTPTVGTFALSDAAVEGLRIREVRAYLSGASWQPGSDWISDLRFQVDGTAERFFPRAEQATRREIAAVAGGEPVDAGALFSLVWPPPNRASAGSGPPKLPLSVEMHFDRGGLASATIQNPTTYELPGLAYLSVRPFQVMSISPAEIPAGQRVATWPAPDRDHGWQFYGELSGLTVQLPAPSVAERFYDVEPTGTQLETTQPARLATPASVTVDVDPLVASRQQMPYASLRRLFGAAGSQPQGPALRHLKVELLAGLLADQAFERSDLWISELEGILGDLVILSEDRKQLTDAHAVRLHGSLLDRVGALQPWTPAAPADVASLTGVRFDDVRTMPPRPHDWADFAYAVPAEFGFALKDPGTGVIDRLTLTPIGANVMFDVGFAGGRVHVSGDLVQGRVRTYEVRIPGRLQCYGNHAEYVATYERPLTEPGQPPAPAAVWRTHRSVRVSQRIRRFDAGPVQGFTAVAEYSLRGEPIVQGSFWILNLDPPKEDAADSESILCARPSEAVGPGGTVETFAARAWLDKLQFAASIDPLAKPDPDSWPPLDGSDCGDTVPTVFLHQLRDATIDVGRAHGVALSIPLTSPEVRTAASTLEQPTRAHLQLKVMRGVSPPLEPTDPVAVAAVALAAAAKTRMLDARSRAIDAWRGLVTTSITRLQQRARELGESLAPDVDVPRAMRGILRVMLTGSELTIEPLLDVRVTSAIRTLRAEVIQSAELQRQLLDAIFVVADPVLTGPLAAVARTIRALRVIVHDRGRWNDFFDLGRTALTATITVGDRVRDDLSFTALNGDLDHFRVLVNLQNETFGRWLQRLWAEGDAALGGLAAHLDRWSRRVRDAVEVLQVNLVELDAGWAATGRRAQRAMVQVLLTAADEVASATMALDLSAAADLRALAVLFTAPVMAAIRTLRAARRDVASILRAIFENASDFDPQAPLRDAVWLLRNTTRDLTTFVDGGLADLVAALPSLPAIDVARAALARPIAIDAAFTYFEQLPDRADQLVESLKASTEAMAVRIAADAGLMRVTSVVSDVLPQFLGTEAKRAERQVRLVLAAAASAARQNIEFQQRKADGVFEPLTQTLPIKGKQIADRVGGGLKDAAGAFEGALSLVKFDSARNYLEANLKLGEVFAGLKFLDELPTLPLGLRPTYDPRTRSVAISGSGATSRDKPLSIGSFVKFTRAGDTGKGPRLEYEASATVNHDTGCSLSLRASITGDLTVGVQGIEVVVRDFGVHANERGETGIDIDPAKVDLPGVLQKLSELLSKIAKVKVRLERAARGILSGIAIDLPSITAPSMQISNLSLGASLFLGTLDLAGQFGVALRVHLAARDRPFLVTYLALGGIGWASIGVEVPLARPALSALVIDLGLGVAAALAFSAGPLAGCAMISLSLNVEVRLSAGQSGVALQATLLVLGELDIGGIISASVSLTLAMRYESGNVKGFGRFELSISMFMFSLDIAEDIEYALSGSSEAPPATAAPTRLAFAGAHDSGLDSFAALLATTPPGDPIDRYLDTLYGAA